MKNVKKNPQWNDRENEPQHQNCWRVWHFLSWVGLPKIGFCTALGNMCLPRPISLSTPLCRKNELIRCTKWFRVNIFENILLFEYVSYTITLIAYLNSLPYWLLKLGRFIYQIKNAKITQCILIRKHFKGTVVRDTEFYWVKI